MPDMQERLERYKERIYDLREDAGISQKALGEYLNLDQKTISDYERGRTRIPITVLIRIAEYFDVSIDYITGVSNIRKSFPKNKSD